MKEKRKENHNFLFKEKKYQFLNFIDFFLFLTPLLIFERQNAQKYDVKHKF